MIDGKKEDTETVSSEVIAAAPTAEPGYLLFQGAGVKWWISMPKPGAALY
jgi:hypothetical protein